MAVARPLHYPDLVTPTSAVLACAAAKLTAAAVSGLNILTSPQLEDTCTFILFNPKEFFSNVDLNNFSMRTGTHSTYTFLLNRALMNDFVPKAFLSTFDVLAYSLSILCAVVSVLAVSLYCYIIKRRLDTRGQPAILLTVLHSQSGIM